LALSVYREVAGWRVSRAGGGSAFYVRHRTHAMKSFATIIALAAALSITYAAQVTDSSLELVLCDDHVVFTEATNISMVVIFRNVGETNMDPFNLTVGLSVVLDGKEYKHDPKRLIGYTGLRWLQPKSGWTAHVSLSDYPIPPDALVSGQHTVALKDAAAESNIQTIFIEPPK
jgi:hypothetical protein